MKILFDINHPAHVHLFRNAIHILKKQGHNVIVTARDKDITLELLRNYKIEFISLSKARSKLIGLGSELIWRQLKLFPILLKNKIQVIVAVTGACSVHVALLLRIPRLIFYDTEHATLQNALTIPFATSFITPDCFLKKVGKNHLTYAGVHDLAYLHPKYFTPDSSVLNLLHLQKGEKFIIMRFVAWSAAHDVGQKGISLSLKRKIIQQYTSQAKVMITSESTLPDEFEPYRMRLPPEKIHDALYFAHMHLGEGGSMATEAAVLGTPSILVNSLSAGVFQEIEKKYGLMRCFHPDQEKDILQCVQDFWQNHHIKEEWQEKRQKFLGDKIDLTEWMVDFILQFG